MQDLKSPFLDETIKLLKNIGKDFSDVIAIAVKGPCKFYDIEEFVYHYRYLPTFGKLGSEMIIKFFDGTSITHGNWTRNFPIIEDESYFKLTNIKIMTLYKGDILAFRDHIESDPEYFSFFGLE
jgi:hypothetical protein